jgi:hypothetical protein
MDGTLKHLGVKSDMDARHNVQKAECLNTVVELGETVMSAIARSRDRCTAIGYCVRTNVVYRAQNSSWAVKDFDDVDKKFLALVKKATLNKNSFPNRLLVSERKHGGLGIISISQAAHERKRKVLLELVNRRGAEGVAAQGLLVNALRASGQGGNRLSVDVDCTQWGRGTGQPNERNRIETKSGKRRREESAACRQL